MSRNKPVMKEELNSSSDSEESDEESEDLLRGPPPPLGTADGANNTLSLVDDADCILVRQTAKFDGMFAHQCVAYKLRIHVCI